MLIMGRDYLGELNVLHSGLYGNLIRYNENPVYGAKIINTYTQNSLNSFSKYISGNRADIWVAGGGFTILYNNNFVSDVEPIHPNLSISFSLLQNYPNPFNPSTTISWQLPAGSWQTLKIYDVLGNEVVTLVDEYRPAGKYKVEFNGTGLTSGVYFYQLRAGEFISTRKFVLLK